MSRENAASVAEKKQHRGLRLFAWLITLVAVLIALTVLPGKARQVGNQPDAARFVRDSQLIPFNVLSASQPDVPVVWNMVQAEPEQAKPLFSVCIDPGHGGVDGGCSDGSRLEKVDNLTMGLALREALEQRNVEVVMTRTKDEFVKLQERSRIANDAGVHYFISLHRNENPDGEGVETWMSGHSESKETEALANAVQKALVKIGVNRDRGVKVGSQGGGVEYYVLRTTEMSAILIELGFVDNSDDNAVLDAHQEEYAQAMADAVVGVYEKYHGAKTDT